MAEERFSDRVFRAVARIPRGRVASYGLVAKVAGSPRAARHAGMVMRLCPPGTPWWRVVREDGTIAIRNEPMAREQAERLAAEGVTFEQPGRVDMARHVWRPRI